MRKVLLTPHLPLPGNLKAVSGSLCEPTMHHPAVTTGKHLSLSSLYLSLSQVCSLLNTCDSDTPAPVFGTEAGTEPRP